MRPPVLDDLGLLPALDFMARGLKRRSQLAVRVTGSKTRVCPEIETHLYRIAQEALNNVVRHARARRAWVELQVAGGEATLEVRDDGCGFVAGATQGRPGERVLGLLGMRERVDALGGRLQVESAPGSGTRVRATVPL
jgi:signal transduction histidine kinase